ncbi:bifunctional nuclease domain-containing protein [Candidatus Poribacteria bacterium]
MLSAIQRPQNRSDRITMKLSDETIIRRCLEGDGNAFSLLVEKYQNAVYGLCYHMVGNFADAQDLTQETFVRAYLELVKVREPTRFASWLYRITVNVCRMWLRDRKGTDNVPLEAVAQTEEEFADNNSPAEHAEAEELRLSITEAIASLSEKNRLAITLYYIDGLSYGEIGDFLSVSPSAVKSRLHRARKELKEELITMVEDKFDEHQLPEDFSEKVVHEVEVKYVKMKGKGESTDDPVAPIVFLGSKTDEKQLLPIFVGVFEAFAITTTLDGSQQLSRPMTHDLMANMLKEFGMEVVRVVVTDLLENTFYARITVKSDGKLKEIDARPSDAIALALRTGAPIFVAKSVWSESSIEATGEEKPAEGESELFISQLYQEKVDTIRMKEPPKKEEK